jgi:hypothetical protein
MSLSTTSFPYFIFLVPVVIIVILAVALIWYTRSFPHHRKIKILAIPAILIAGMVVVLCMSLYRATRSIEIVDVQCGDSRLFPGTIAGVDPISKKNITLFFPFNDQEGGRMAVFDSMGNPYDTWYISDFCHRGDFFEKEIKGKDLTVVTNGYRRVVEWRVYKK